MNPHAPRLGLPSASVSQTPHPHPPGLGAGKEIEALDKVSDMQAASCGPEWGVRAEAVPLCGPWWGVRAEVGLSCAWLPGVTQTCALSGAGVPARCRSSELELKMDPPGLTPCSVTVGAAGVLQGLVLGLAPAVPQGPRQKPHLPAL